MKHTFSYLNQFKKQTPFLKHDKTKKAALAGASIITLVASGGSNNSPHTGNVSTASSATEDTSLTADTSTISDPNGLGSFDYQWKIGSVDIAGATANTYTPTQSDVNSGNGISVKVTFQDGDGNTETSISTPTNAVININDAPQGTLSISGTATQGQTLTANNNISDEDGLGTFSYQWTSNNVVVGSNTSTYNILTSDVGNQIKVKISYTDAQGTAETVISNATNIVTSSNNPAIGSVTINGVATQNQILSIQSQIYDADGYGPLSYQWYSNGVAISGATSAQYTLTEAEVNAIITVQVSYVDGAGNAESFLSPPTALVQNVNDVPVGSVTISGNLVINDTLTANNNLTDLDGLGTFNYQWFSDGNLITGANNSTYTLTNAEASKAISVHISYSDGHATNETVASTQSIPVAQASVLKIADFNTSNGIRLKGSDDYESTGTEISKAGDFNADGYDDFLLNSFTGKGYLIYGSQNGLNNDIQLSNLTAAQGTTFNKSGLNELSGYDISDIGDVNGDGYDDIIITSFTKPSGPYTAHVVFGNSTGLGANFDLSSLNGTNGFSFANITNGVNSVSAIGDFNADGFDDFSITNQFGDQTSAVNGYSSTYVIFGKSTFNNGFDLATLNGNNGFVAKTALSVLQKDTESTGAGDINADGFDDLIIGNVHATSSGNPEGSAYVVFGTATPITTELDLGALNGSNGFNIEGSSTQIINGSPLLYNWFGRSVTGINDINGDGIDDFAVTAGNNGGDAYVFFGSNTAYTNASFDLTTLNGSNGFKLTGSRKNDIADAGDINGDGYADLIIGGQLLSNGGVTNSGSAYILFGHANGFNASIDLNALNGSDGFRIDGNTNNGYFGGSVDGAGDVNGDGFDDIIIGAYGHEQDGSVNPIGKGENFLIYGGTHFSAVVNSGTNGSSIINPPASGPAITVAGRGSDILNGGVNDDILMAGLGDDDLRGGAGADILTGGGGRDEFFYTAGDTVLTIGGSGNNGTISGFDIIKDFEVGDGTHESEIFNMPLLSIASNTSGTDGINGSLTDSNVTIKSHKIENGVITFDELDTYNSNSMKISTESQIAMATEYLQLQDFGTAGTTLVFDAGADSFIFVQGDDIGTDNLDILTRLEDVQVDNLVFGSTAIGEFDLLLV